MSNASRSHVGPTIAGALLIIAGAALILTSFRGGSASPTTLAASESIQAEDTPEPTPRFTPYPKRSAECPEMDNPGGGIMWRKSADAGPWPTDSTVAIPDLGVTAPVVKVGVDMNSEMVVPRNARDVAWLDQGPFPGRTNNVVLAGHINWNRVRGSFAGIGELAAGDRFTLTVDGAEHVFEVRWNCAFPWDSDFAEQIMGRTTTTSVTLITCSGTFDPSQGTHNRRTAVRAELIDPELA